MQHFLKIDDFNSAEFWSILESAISMKRDDSFGTGGLHLEGKTLGMIFEKPSNRTRVSFEVGMFQLGGHAVYIQKQDIGMGSREPIADVARVLSRYVDGVVIRAMSHDTIAEFAAVSLVPVINGLSDLYHPCQAVADVLTIVEHKENLQGRKMVYVGDGNNVCVSLAQLCHLLGMEVVVACPRGYEPPVTGITIESDVRKAVANADVIYTDVWVSMGQEAETEKRLADFKGFMVDMDLVKLAKPDAIVMHCLPAQRGFEITHEVFESPQSVVFDQAENRLHAQKAILVKLLG